jgi:hypothetical protein
VVFDDESDFACGMCKNGGCLILGFRIMAFDFCSSPFLFRVQLLAGVGNSFGFIFHSLVE